MSDVEQQPEPGPAEVTPEPAPAMPAVVHAAEPSRVCEVSLEEFEGPLDLLLHLVRRHELDILDIPIAFVCEKYLEYIEFMQALDLEVAGDYLVMAATLAYLKSRELVPQQPEEVEEGEDEEGPDPREQLIVRLLEYQKFKDAASRLDQRPMSGRDTFARGQDVELPPLDAGLAPITLFRLAEAYSRVLERARIHKSHEVVMETISVATRMEQLAEVLLDRSRFDFEALFLERSWSSEAELRSMLVVTLMSILELVRMGVASVHQPVGTDAIVVERVADAEHTREALRGYDESVSFGDGKPRGEPAGEGDAEAAQEGPVEAVEEPPAGAEAVEAEAVEEPPAGVEVEAEAAESPADAGAESSKPVEPTVAEVSGAAQATDVSALGPDLESDGGTEDSAVRADEEGAGVSGQSVVSESPSATVTVAEQVVPEPTPAHGASETAQIDGQDGENGEAEALEGS